MLENIEDILDTEINRIKNDGNFKIQKNLNISPELKIAKILFALPKNQIPEPNKQRKYALSPILDKTLHNGFKFLKIAFASGGSLAIVGTIIFAGMLSAKALPGQTLFKVKKVAEQTRLHLTFNETNKAKIQIELTEKRLNEAKQIFANSEFNTAPQKFAALNELASQTQITTQTIKKVAVSTAISKLDHPLVTSLEIVAKQQKDFAEKIQPQDGNSSLSLNALNTSQQSNNDVKEIKNLISVALTDNTQIHIAKLSENNNSISALGKIVKKEKSIVIVEGLNFLVTPDTLIKTQDEKILAIQQIKDNSLVNIIGKKSLNTKESFIANQILLLATPDDEKNKPVTLPPVSPNTSLKENIFDNENLINDSDIITGSFIVEDPKSEQ
jgi:hypothetical protein